MNRQDFHKQSGNFYEEPPKNLPIRNFDVVVAGGGTAGVVAALAAARQGAKTMLRQERSACLQQLRLCMTTTPCLSNVITEFPAVS